MKAGEALRVGLVGCGEAANWHIASMRKMGGVEVVAVCDLNEDLAKRTAGRFNISRHYTDFKKMLADEKLNVVDICAPPQTHVNIAKLAADAKCHVLTEKPLALNLGDADTMIEAARKNGVKLCVVHNELFLPVVMKARSVVARGDIGDVVGVSIHDSMPGDNGLLRNKEHWCHRLPGGIFGEMLPHPIYLAMAFMGKLEPVAVHSRKVGKYDWVKADELRVILDGKNGVATITESVNWPEDYTVVDIFGTKASLHVDLWSLVMTRYAIANMGRLIRGRQNLAQGFQRLGGTTAATLGVIFGRYHSGHYTLIRKFIESLQNGTESPVTPEEGREVIRLYQAITSQIK